MKLTKQFFVPAAILVLMISVSCSQPTSSEVSTLDTWLNRADLQEPFTPVDTSRVAARMDHSVGDFDANSPASEMLDNSVLGGSVSNIALMKGVIDTIQSSLSGNAVETNQIVSINDIAFTLTPEYTGLGFDIHIGLEKVKVVYDESNFVTYIIWDMQNDAGTRLAGPYYASLEVNSEADGSFTTIIVSNSGDDGQNYFEYNNQSGILIYKSEGDSNDDDVDEVTDHDYMIYTPTDLSLGYGNIKYIRLMSHPITAKDFLVIENDSDGIYLHEDDENSTITLFWDIDTGYQGEFTGTLPTSMSDLITDWIDPSTETTATDLSIQSMLPAIKLVIDEMNS